MSSSVFDTLVSFVLVQKCACCNKRISKSAVCENCETFLEYVGDDFCRKCARKKDKCTCGKSRRSFAAAAAVFDFDNPVVKALIYKIKKKGDKESVKYLADKMAKRVKREFKGVSFDAVTFVPSDLHKLCSNGFCHAALLAKEISKLIGTPLKSPPAVKKNRAKNQKQMTSAERRYNARASYKFRKRDMSGNVLLVDDVITTGATLDACSDLIKRAGAKKVYCILGASAK